MREARPVAERRKTVRTEAKAKRAPGSRLSHAAIEEIMRVTIELGGTLSGEHGIGVAKSPYLGFEIHDKELELMRSLKRLFDPNNILNPGKIFPD